MNDEHPCTICGEEECICEYCPYCNTADVPCIVRGRKECPNCGESMGDPGERDNEESAWFINMEIAGLKRNGY
jgi:hypothetical protein